MLHFSFINNKKGNKMVISKESAIERLKHDCRIKDELLNMSAIQRERDAYGECYVTDKGRNKVLQKGSIERVMWERNLLRENETISNN